MRKMNSMVKDRPILGYQFDLTENISLKGSGQFDSLKKNGIGYLALSLQKYFNCFHFELS